MNQIHVLLSIYNTHFCKDMNQIHVLLSIHNVHVLLGHESDTCITVYT